MSNGDFSVLECFDVQELSVMETICEGQDSDLKADFGVLRYWLSRVGPEDGQNYPITVEVRLLQGWRTLYEYGSWEDWEEQKEEEEEIAVDDTD